MEENSIKPSSNLVGNLGSAVHELYLSIQFYEALLVTSIQVSVFV